MPDHPTINPPNQSRPNPHHVPIIPPVESSPPPHRTSQRQPPYVSAPNTPPPHMIPGLGSTHFLSISESITKLSYQTVQVLLADAAIKHQDVFCALQKEFYRAEEARLQGQRDLLAQLYNNYTGDRPSLNDTHPGPAQSLIAEKAARRRATNRDEEGGILDPRQVESSLIEKWEKLSIYMLCKKDDAVTDMVIAIAEIIVRQFPDSPYGPTCTDVSRALKRYLEEPLKEAWYHPRTSHGAHRVCPEKVA
ncbi:hypothetical protein KCU65_g2283, partial [Aureobasidium melanogenum]